MSLLTTICALDQNVQILLYSYHAIHLSYIYIYIYVYSLYACLAPYMTFTDYNNDNIIGRSNEKVNDDHAAPIIEPIYDTVDDVLNDNSVNCQQLRSRQDIDAFIEPNPAYGVFNYN